MKTTPSNGKLEISKKALNDALEQIQRAYFNPESFFCNQGLIRTNASLTEELENLLVAVERTLHWIKGGAKGELLNPSGYSRREVIVKVSQVSQVSQVFSQNNHTSIQTKEKT